jgi:hypothetical protein
MAKATKTPDALLAKAIEQITELWEKRNKKFFDALEDSEKRRINVNFCVTLDLSESAPIIDTEISFKDNCKESGMNVTKTFRDSTSEQLDDPKAPPLPGMEKGKKKEATE